MTDDELKHLFEIAGPRKAPPDDSRERIEATVRDAWEGISASPGRHVRARPYLLAGGLAAAIVVAWLAWFPHAAESATIGEITYATGAYTIVNNGGRDGPFVTAGATVRTSPDGRVLLRLGGQRLLRLDSQSELTLHSRQRLHLYDGRLFVDSTGASVAVETPGGIRIDDIGTQFEVAVHGDRITVAVREGQVKLVAGTEVISSAARDGLGETLVLEGFDLLSRQRTSTDHSRWDWIHAAMPAFELDSATVLDFLVWATREAGTELEFADDHVRHRAGLVRLHGPPIAASVVDRKVIQEILQTAPSFEIAASGDHRIVIRLATSDATHRGEQDFSPLRTPRDSIPPAGTST